MYCRHRFWHATLRMHSAIRRHHPLQRAVLSQICCFGEHKMLFQILLDSAEPRDVGMTWLSSPSLWEGRLTGSSWHLCFIHAHNMPKQDKPERLDYSCDFGCFVSLHTSSFRTNWHHLMPSSICRNHWSSASILHASVLDIAQQSEPYRNIGKMQVLYSFNCVEMASRDLQIWFSMLCMASRVMALRRLMSQVLPVDEWIREPR